MKAGDIIRHKASGKRLRLRWVHGDMAGFEYVRRDGQRDRRHNGYSGGLTDAYELERAAVHGQWTGPLESDLMPDGTTLRAPVPPERWPFGLPDAHQDCCNLRASGGLFCDCEASDASAPDHGEAP